MSEENIYLDAYGRRIKRSILTMRQVDMKYQGWANSQTWCIALTIDNERDFLSDAIYMLSNYKPEHFKHKLRTYVRINFKKFFDMAPWVWENFTNPLAALNIVDWEGLQKHYENKKGEGVT